MGHKASGVTQPAAAASRQQWVKISALPGLIAQSAIDFGRNLAATTVDCRKTPRIGIFEMLNTRTFSEQQLPASGDCLRGMPRLQIDQVRPVIINAAPFVAWFSVAGRGYAANR